MYLDYEVDQPEVPASLANKEEIESELSDKVTTSHINLLNCFNSR